MTIGDDLTCQDLVEIITDYLEGALPPAERERFESHLRGCTGCRNYLGQMRLTIALAGRLAPEDLSPGVQSDLLTAFRTWKRP